MKFFPGHGKFFGTVIQINKGNMDGKPIYVWYEDKEEEDYSQDEVDELQRSSSIPIGSVGFQLVKKIVEVGCSVLDGGKQYAYSHTEIEAYAMNKFTVEQSNSNTTNTDSEESEDDEDAEAEEDEHDNSSDNDVDIVDNMPANNAAATTTKK
eukprot:8627977-Ditylum_brightwellii.AAC.1